jgi:hypothetical protein
LPLDFSSISPGIFPANPHIPLAGLPTVFGFRENVFTPSAQALLYPFQHLFYKKSASGACGL